MSAEVLAAMIGGLAIVAAAIIARRIDREPRSPRGGGQVTLRSSRVKPDAHPRGELRLAGSTWKSIWKDDDGKEVFEFVHFMEEIEGQVSGQIWREERKWRLHGDTLGRVLRFFWTSLDTELMDCGCYFFERKGNRVFEGYAVGFKDAEKPTDPYVMEFGKHQLVRVDASRR